MIVGFKQRIAFLHQDLSVNLTKETTACFNAYRIIRTMKTSDAVFKLSQQGVRSHHQKVSGLMDWNDIEVAETSFILAERYLKIKEGLVDEDRIDPTYMDVVRPIQREVVTFNAANVIGKGHFIGCVPTGVRIASCGCNHI